jgi:hypothetical protein
MIVTEECVGWCGVAAGYAEEGVIGPEAMQPIVDTMEAGLGVWSGNKRCGPDVCWLYSTPELAAAMRGLLAARRAGLIEFTPKAQRLGKPLTQGVYNDLVK